METVYQNLTCWVNHDLLVNIFYLILLYNDARVLLCYNSPSIV